MYMTFSMHLIVVTSPYWRCLIFQRRLIRSSVDHAALLRRLQTTYGITGTALVWFASYLHERKRSVRYRGSSSTPSSFVMWSTPRIGPLLGPIIFCRAYTADLLGLIEGMDLHPHVYADDTQIYGFCAPDEASALQQRTSICVTQTSEWLKVNRLQLNTAKSEQLWCTSPRQQNRLPNIPLHVGCDIVQPASCVRNLGIFIDSDVSMKNHISKTVSSCFAALRRLRSIRRSVSQAVLLSLVGWLVKAIHYDATWLWQCCPGRFT